MIQTVGYKFEENKRLVPVVEHQRQREVNMVPVHINPKLTILINKDADPIERKRILKAGNELYNRNVFIRENTDEIYY